MVVNVLILWATVKHVVCPGFSSIIMQMAVSLHVVDSRQSLAQDFMDTQERISSVQVHPSPDFGIIVFTCKHLQSLGTTVFPCIHLLTLGTTVFPCILLLTLGTTPQHFDDGISFAEKTLCLIDLAKTQQLLA